MHTPSWCASGLPHLCPSLLGCSKRPFPSCGAWGLQVLRLGRVSRSWSFPPLASGAAGLPLLPSTHPPREPCRLGSSLFRGQGEGVCAHPPRPREGWHRVFQPGRATVSCLPGRGGAGSPHLCTRQGPHCRAQVGRVATSVGGVLSALEKG